MLEIPKVQNPELYEKLKEFTVECTNFLQGLHSVEDYKNLINGMHYIKGKELPPYEFAREDRLNRLMYEHFKEIQSLPAYEILFEFLTEKEKRIFWNGAFDFLKFYYALTKEFRFDPEIFDLVYQKLEEFKFTRNRSSMFLSPLQNFESELDEILLEGDIKIRSISSLEIYRIVDYSTPTTVGHPQNTNFTLEKIQHYREPDSRKGVFYERKDVLSIERDFERVVIALRLFKKGDLGIPLKHIELPTDWGVSGGSAIHKSMFAPFFAIGEKYKLTKEEIPLFQDFWKDFRDKQFEKNVQIALNRLTYFYSRKMPEDNIIDCMIALEALFGPEKKNRISMVVSIKTAILLGDSKKQTKEIFNYIRNVYKIRNCIVHGDEVTTLLKKMGNKYSDLRKLALELQELLRRSIRRYLDGEVDKKKRYFELVEMLEMNDGEEIIDRVHACGEVKNGV